MSNVNYTEIVCKIKEEHIKFYIAPYGVIYIIMIYLL